MRVLSTQCAKVSQPIGSQGCSSASIAPSLSGSAKQWDHTCLCHAIWKHLVFLGAEAQIMRVPTEENLADLPSRCGPAMPRMRCHFAFNKGSLPAVGNPGDEKSEPSAARGLQGSASMGAAVPQTWLLPSGSWSGCRGVRLKSGACKPASKCTCSCPWQPRN